MTLLDRLMSNLTKFFKTDHNIIYSLMVTLGTNHAHLVVNNYHQILGISKMYLNKEPYQDDPAYIAKSILIANAAKKINPNQRIIATLQKVPFYFEKHLDYFWDKYE